MVSKEWGPLHLVNAIGGFTERIIYWSWGGEPALQLLKNKKCGRIEFYEVDKIKGLVKNYDGEITNKKIFQIAMRLSGNDNRVKDMNASYVFSRSILTSLVIGYIMLMPSFFEDYLFHVISIFIIILSWYRAKERAFYYAKEVLQSAINKLESDKNPRQT